MKKKFIKKMNETTRKTISCFFVLVYTLMQILSPLTVYADTKDETPQKGDIRNNNVVVEDNNIRVTKTITPKKDADGNVIEGKYTVGFDFVGKETEISTTNPLYAVIVFDTSGSMICSTESYSSMYNPWMDWSGYDYEAADGAKVRCESQYGSHMGDHLLQSKWESAVSGAQDFAKEIMEIEDSQVSVVTFSTNAQTATKWYTANSTDLSDGTIPASVFRHPYGGTNLSEGIDNAVTKLNSITEANANKIIIVVSDGEPTQPDNPVQSAYSSATSAKNGGIKIFTIGYETTSNADTILANVSGSNVEGDETTYNYTASEGNLSGIFTSIATSISNIVNANSITLTDNLGASFHFSDGTGNTYTHEIETITTEGTHVEFDIEIDPDSPTGWNPTNNGFSLTYTTSAGDVTLSTNENPEVYWIQQEYNYTINYYLDDTNGTPVHTDTGTNVLNAKIDVDEIKYLSEYTGYEYTGSNDLSITISRNENENVINVVYTKINYDYIIKYYLDDTNGEPAHTDTGTGNYNDQITVNEEKYLANHPGYEYTGENKDFTISTNNDENVVIIVYTKIDYNYTINYYHDEISEDNFIDNVTGTGNYGDAITVDEGKYLSSYPGYEYTGGNKDFNISVNTEDNIINIVYTKIIYNYTINYYKDEISENNFLGQVTGTGNYNDPVTVNEELYLTGLTGYEYAGTNRDFNISLDVENNVINIIYTKALYNYQINYYFDEISEENKVATVSNYANYNTPIEVNELLHVNDRPGYEYAGIDRDFVVSINPENNIIDIVYTKIDYTYTINYYLDDTTGTPVQTETGTGNYGDPITVNEGKYLNNYPGYEYTGNDLDTTISTTESDNIINVVYTKIDYIYTINYYHDEISENNFINKVTGTGNYGDAINVDETLYLTGLTGYEYVGGNLDTTISTIEANNIINVVYTKANFILEVNYFFDGVPNTDLTKKVSIQYGTRVYASTYNLTTEEIAEHNLNGYKLNPSTPYEPTYVVIDIENNLIKIYYVSPTTQDGDSISKNTDDTITSTDDTVTYSINYSNTLKNVIGTVTVTIVDTLPLNIDKNNSKLNNGVYNDNDKTITWTYTYNIDTFTEEFNINENFEYTVKYLNIDPEYSYTGDVYTNKINATASVNYEEETTTFEDTDNEEDVSVEIYGNLTVEYVTYEENNKINLADTISDEKLVGTPYETEDKEFYGYTLKEVIGNKNGKYAEEDTIVTYVYEKNAGNIDDKLTKDGTKEINGLDTPIEYTITYNAKITDYIGNAKVTITDKLPAQIDTNLSNIDGGTYNIDENTITWILTYNIDERNTEINITKNISIVYLNINTESITNSATSLIELDKNKENNTDETVTKVNKGKVVVHYVEKDTNINLAEDVILEDFVGKTYTTEEKAIDEYFVSEVIGETSGEYTKDTIVVTYVYEKIGKGTDILPPQTGIDINSNNPYVFYILSMIILLIYGMFRKVNE